jgi:hypothetical protein
MSAAKDFSTSATFVGKIYVAGEPLTRLLATKYEVKLDIANG